MYIICRIEDGKMVSKPGSEKSYTTSMLQAQRFETEEEAKRHCCGNEYVVSARVMAKKYVGHFKEYLTSCSPV